MVAMILGAIFPCCMLQGARLLTCILPSRQHDKSRIIISPHGTSAQQDTLGMPRDSVLPPYDRPEATGMRIFSRCDLPPSLSVPATPLHQAEFTDPGPSAFAAAGPVPAVSGTAFAPPPAPHARLRQVTILARCPAASQHDCCFGCCARVCLSLSPTAEAGPAKALEGALEGAPPATRVAPAAVTEAAAVVAAAFGTS